MWKWLGGNIAEFFTFFAGGEALKSWLGDFGAKTIKSHFGGFGESDEVLTLEAFQIANAELGVSPDDCARIGRLLKTLTPSQRNKMSNIIGFDEQEIKIDTTEGSGKDVNKKSVTQKKNARGAALIKFLSELTDDQIMDILEGTGSLCTVSETIARHIASLVTTGQTNWPQLKSTLQNLAQEVSAQLQANVAEPVKTWVDSREQRSMLRRIFWS